MDEKELIGKIDNLEKKVEVLEKEISTIAKITQSERVKEYITSAEKARKIASLLDISSKIDVVDNFKHNKQISDILLDKPEIHALYEAKEYVGNIENSITEEIEKNNKVINAYDGNFLFEYEEIDGNITIIKYIGFDDLDIVVIPDSINGLLVTSVGERAFENCKGIKEVILPKSVNFIGRRAFARSGLTKINLLNVRKIEYEAFASTYLNEITIPKCMKYIAAGAFSGCIWLERIFISGILLEIGNGAFKFCGKTRGMKVDIPNGLIKILPEAFWGVHNLKIRIPDSVELIGGEGVFNKDACIYCNSGSYALKYARANGIEIHRYEEFDLLEG